MDLEQFGVTFDEENLNLSTLGNNSTKIHIRIQQRNGRKSITTASGLPETTDFKKILKIWQKKVKLKTQEIEVKALEVNKHQLHVLKFQPHLLTDSQVLL